MRAAYICCGKEECAPSLHLKEPSQFPGGLNQSEDEIRERPIAQQERGSRMRAAARPHAHHRPEVMSDPFEGAICPHIVGYH